MADTIDIARESPAIGRLFRNTMASRKQWHYTIAPLTDEWLRMWIAATPLETFKRWYAIGVLDLREFEAVADIALKAQHG